MKVQNSVCRSCIIYERYQMFSIPLSPKVYLIYSNRLFVALFLVRHFEGEEKCQKEMRKNGNVWDEKNGVDKSSTLASFIIC